MFFTCLFLIWISIILCYHFYKWISSCNAGSSKAKKYLEGKTVFITGASSGLGKEIAREFFHHGCKIIMAARRLKELDKIKHEFQKAVKMNNGLSKYNLKTITPITCQLDLSDPEKCEEVALKIIKDHNVDILINNAGISARAASIDTTLDVELSLFNTNYLSQVTMTKIFLNSMIERGNGGHVLAVSSVQGHIGIPYRTSYSATKHALQGYYAALRSEMSQIDPKICIAIISPGYIKTSISMNAMNADGTRYGKMDNTIANGYEPEYVACCILEMIVNKHQDKILAPIHHRLLIIVQSIAPDLTMWMLKRYASKQIRPKKES